jgi:hypothetical protein
VLGWKTLEILFSPLLTFQKWWNIHRRCIALSPIFIWSWICNSQVPEIWLKGHFFLLDYTCPVSNEAALETIKSKQNSNGGSDLNHDHSGLQINTSSTNHRTTRRYASHMALRLRDATSHAHARVTKRPTAASVRAGRPAGRGGTGQHVRFRCGARRHLAGLNHHRLIVKEQYY